MKPTSYRRRSNWSTLRDPIVNCSKSLHLRKFQLTLLANKEHIYAPKVLDMSAKMNVGNYNLCELLNLCQTNGHTTPHHEPSLIHIECLHRYRGINRRHARQMETLEQHHPLPSPNPSAKIMRINSEYTLEIDPREANTMTTEEATLTSETIDNTYE